MKIGDEEYKALLTQYLSEELQKEERKPDGFYGHWSWSVSKTKQFVKKLRDEGKLEE